MNRSQANQVATVSDRAKTWYSVSLVLLVLIVFTGAAVRLTDSGLGCEDWPGCSEDRLVPEMEAHGLIEFGNRLLSGIVLLVALGLALHSFRTQRALNRLTYTNLWIAGLVITQAIVGLLTVRSVLDPRIVGIHFGLSMVLIWLGAKALYLSRSQEVEPNQDILAISKSLLIPMSLVMFLGVIVTGTGPNSGDTRATRLSFDLETVARFHALSAWLLILTTIYFLYRYRTDLNTRTFLTRFASALIAQGAIGYVQYLVGVPPLLVLCHVIAATLIWTYLVMVNAKQRHSPFQGLTLANAD